MRRSVQAGFASRNPALLWSLAEVMVSSGGAQGVVAALQLVTEAHAAGGSSSALTHLPVSCDCVWDVFGGWSSSGCGSQTAAQRQDALLGRHA
jgi:hypothetical protein